jgi:hypothetical protein
MNEVGWAGQGQWLRADLHMHSRASDGAVDITTLATRARENGCEVIAVTDHGDRKLRAATPEYMTDIATARLANSGLVLLAGLEWNVPPFGGREHAGVLFPDDPDVGPALAEFKQRFDDYDRGDESQPTAEAALAWLTEISRNLPTKPVVIYNHPTRKDDTSLENVQDVLNWRKGNDLVIGFEGGPGHQGKPPIGSYGGKEPAIDRWDPVVARPGDAWDKLLQQGMDISGASANSDFHTDSPNDLNDFWPCQFAETWIYAPDKSIDGVLRALRAGAFFGSHGHIVRELELTALVDGLTRPAMVGEVLRVPEDSEVAVVLSFEVPASDWQQQPNSVDTVDFFVITPSNVDVRSHTIKGAGSQTVGDRVKVGKEGVVVRARVRRTIADGPDLMAYTNPIRVRSW